MTYRHLMITMLLGGLWHGAAWTFVVWGALHGTYLVGEHALRGLFGWSSRSDARKPILADLASITLTFLLVLVAWVFFRASSVSDALVVLRAMFHPTASGLTLPAKPMLKDGIWLVPLFAYYVHAYLKERGYVVSVSPTARGVAIGVLAFLTLVCREVSDAFIYFQF